MRSLWLMLLAGSTVFAQPPSIDPPVAGRPADFSNLVGAYAIQARAEPTEVCVEEPITLRITITGTGPDQYRPRRENLRLFPEWDDDFYVQEMRDEHHAEPEKRTWTFVYRLRPKHTGVNAIDGIKLVFYNPDKPGRLKYETRRAAPIAIVVKPKPDLAAKIEVPMTKVPDSFYRQADDANILPARLGGDAVSPIGVALALFVIPLICVAAALAWRRRFPNELEQRRRRRDRAADRALANLEKRTEPAWTVVHRYLRERLDFCIAEPTGKDVASFLTRRGFAKNLCAQARDFCRMADGALYACMAPAADLDGVAAQLIRSLEADPCVDR